MKYKYFILYLLDELCTAIMMKTSLIRYYFHQYAEKRKNIRI